MVPRALKDFSRFDKAELVELLLVSQGSLEKKRMELRKTREKLNLARKRIRKMKDIILYQRYRILEQ